jgi:dimethylamine/trimethylamine dehydrogenase
MHLGCTQNPTAGEEYRRGWHPEEVPPAANADRTALVVGAGPAGMECAIILAKRGLEVVHLVDAGDDLGGHLGWVTRLPGLGEWGRLIDHRRVQISKLANLEFVPGTRLDAAAVCEYGAAIVVVATGARWALDGHNGMTRGTIAGADASLPRVLTPEQLMLEGKEVPGRRVAVVDYEGYFAGACLAERLALAGHEVTIVTCFDAISPHCDQTLEGYPVRSRLHELGVGSLRGVTVRSIEPDGLDCEGEFGSRHQLAADAVVLVTQRLSDDALYRELAADPARLAAAGIEALHRIGDCVAPRLIADAIFDGHRLAREIDSPDPARPLPYLRERPLAGVS